MAKTDQFKSNLIWADEKKSLVSKIVSLKAENQHLCFQLEKKSKKINILNDKIELSSQKLHDVEAEMANVKKDLREKQETDRNTIADLLSEKKKLEARIKQIQSSEIINSSLQPTETPNDEQVFEVEKVIADKVVHGKRKYKIRWKGCSSKQDTWEKEENLFCPSILDEYRKSKSTH